MSKTLVIMRGLPGSGKSTKAKSLGEGGAVFAADDFFMRGGKYVYDPRLSGHAHLWNQGRVKAAMRMGVSPIVVDNTNVKAEHAKPYVDAAKENGYEVSFEEPDSPWWKESFSPDMSEEDKSRLVKELMAHGTHGVPEDVIRKMLDEWQHDLPERMMGRMAMLIIDARTVKVAGEEEKGDGAPGQKSPLSEGEKQKQQVQTSEPTPKVKGVAPGTPIPTSDIPKKMQQDLQPMFGPLRTDPDVQWLLKRPQIYRAIQHDIESGNFGKAVQIQNKYKGDPAAFQKDFPPLKGQEPAIRQRLEKGKEPRSPADSRPVAGNPGPGSKDRQGPATRAPIPTAKASLRTAQAVRGDEPRIFADIPGVEGHVNVNVGVQKVFDAMKSVFPPETFQANGQPMSVLVSPLPGKFGEARYDPNDPTQQNLIHIDLDNIIGAVHKAVENEALKAQDTGIKAQITDDIAKRINVRIAELVWETIGHEAGHLRDYQGILKRMQETGQGSLSEAMESVWEKAGKSAMGRFKQDAW